MKHILILLLIIIACNGWSQATPQQKAELAVTKHLKKTYPKSEYHGYGFSNLIKITPTQITELKEYKKAIASIDSVDENTKNYYDSLIQNKLKEVKEKRLFSTYEINHFYTLKEKFKKPILFEYTFTLLPDGKISDVAKQLEYKLIDDEYDYFYYYYSKKDLHNTKEDNISTYSYLEDLYEKELVNKRAVMSTILTIAKVIYENDAYDTILIPRIEAQKWIKNNLADLLITNYSTVNSIIDSSNNKIIGYNIFAQISQNDSTKAYYFEFDYDYILRGVLPVEAPFEKYFIPNKKSTKKE